MLDLKSNFKLGQMQDRPQLLQVRHRQGGEPEALAELPGRDTGGHLRGQ